MKVKHTLDFVYLSQYVLKNEKDLKKKEQPIIYYKNSLTYNKKS